MSAALNPCLRSQVLFWLLEVLDLAIEYTSESKMGCAELASVFVPWFIPEPRGRFLLGPEKVMYVQPACEEGALPS